MDKVLITGGLGYLGQRLTASLMAENRWDVSLLTRRETAPSHVVSACQVLSFRNSWDREGKSLLTGVRKIVHLACPDDKNCVADPVGAAHEAFAFTHGLVQQAAKCGVESIVLTSSIHVYGAALRHVVTETTPPRPARVYGIIKRFTEDIVAAGDSPNGMHAIVLRLANGFGAPISPNITQWGLLINDLCRQAVESRRIELRSDPRLLRNFVTLTDVCDVIRHFLNRTSAMAAPELLQVGSSRSRSLGEMAELVRSRCTESLGFTPELVLPECSSDEPTPLHYDITRLLATDFHPREDFVSEVDATLLACSRWFTRH